MKPYKIIDHEADTGFEIYGKNMEELYKNAAHALFSLIVDAENVSTKTGKRIDIRDEDNLLIVFLNELLYLWDTEGFIPKELSLKVEDGRVAGSVAGGFFDPDKHTLKNEVKAVTYHKFSVIEEKGILKARIIVDL